MPIFNENPNNQDTENPNETDGNTAEENDNNGVRISGDILIGPDGDLTDISDLGDNPPGV